jgi:integrase
MELFFPPIWNSLFTSWGRKLPIQIVQQLTGHSDISTTRKYYIAVQSEDMVLANKILNRILTETLGN